jgi:preprotein translocase subunit SecA
LYCDEVDSILIDEAQAAIILADTSKDTSVEKFVIVITNYLDFHYTVDEKNKTSRLLNGKSAS